MAAAHTTAPLLTTFALDVQKGLSQTPKRLPSKYFYDARGDELFQRIMQMPEYYLTDCEKAIFESQKADILAAIGHQQFELLELGAGDCYKTKVLLRHFLKAGVSFSYQPVDISANVLEQLQVTLNDELPNLEVSPLVGDYFKVLHELGSDNAVPKVVLFLGANIGNYTPKAALSFLKQLHAALSPGDLLLIGIDLKKDPATILQAYNDPNGITAAFNLNLLTRMNRELGADFDLEQYRHWETYNPVSGATRSFIVSEREQEVYVEALEQYFGFDAWEAIEVELSQKYSVSEVESLLQEAGFSLKRHFTDAEGCFLNTLWVR